MIESARIFNEIVNERRAVRKFHPTDYDPEAVTRSLSRAHLAPSSSNMQLWEFYRISDPEKLKLLSHYCMDQNTTNSAKEMIVVVARPDLWKRRAKSNYDFVLNNYADRESHKGMSTLNYFKKLMPLLYNNDMFGIRGSIKKIVVQSIALFKPMVRQVNRTDMRIVVHKSAALAAQTFMLSMSAEGHDTCPVEGFDSLRVKKMLGLPWRAEINMVITCGKRIPEGIYGKRFRVPESEVIFQV
ncbi:MAG: nitroreductase family protein [Flavobacteriales bacterium]|nr:nitroreductase family protein [Flavobacteriales bacterium]